MKNLEQLTKNFFDIKYPLSSGSDEWWAIKTDYELIDDEIAALILAYEGNLNYETDLDLAYYDTQLNLISQKLNSYTPKNDQEKEELRKISEKLVLADKIVNILLGKAE